MPTFITLTNNSTGVEINLNMDLVKTFIAHNGGSYMRMVHDGGEYCASETPAEIRQKIRTEQNLQAANMSMVSSAWEGKSV